MDYCYMKNRLNFRVALTSDSLTFDSYLVATMMYLSH